MRYTMDYDLIRWVVCNFFRSYYNFLTIQNASSVIKVVFAHFINILILVN